MSHGSQAEVIIVGGGLTGASLAATLAARAAARGRTLRILVLEARPGRGPRFAGELIHPAGIDVLDESALLEPLRRPHDAHAGVAVRGFAVDPGGGEDAALLPYAEVDGARPYGYAMEHHDMVAELRRQATARPGVELRTGVRVLGVVRETDSAGVARVVGVRIAGEHGDAEQEIRAPLTLVAEGRHSRLRHALGIEEESRLLSYTAAVLVEDSELPHDRYGHIFLGGPGPILAYPIAEARGGASTVRMCIDVPTLPDEKGTRAVARYLREAYAPRLPEPLRAGMLRALDVSPPEIAANHSISTRRCVVPGAALVGESGGCSHPLTASGMTVCLTDVRILVDELLDSGPGAAATDVALARYEERRFRFVRAREILADALYDVMRGADEGSRAIRSGLLRYWKGGARARGASMALLSGAESSLPAFLAEYLRVVGHSTGGALLGRIPGNPPTLLGRTRSLSGLVGKSLDKLKFVRRHVRHGEMAW